VRAHPFPAVAPPGPAAVFNAERRRARRQSTWRLLARERLARVGHRGGRNGAELARWAAVRHTLRERGVSLPEASR
jgi:hypothetical protein